MFVLGIDAPIRDMMQRLIEHERLLYERLWEVQSPADFRAVMQMRVTLGRMRDETVAASLTLGNHRRRCAEQQGGRPAISKRLRSTWRA